MEFIVQHLEGLGLGKSNLNNREIQVQILPGHEVYVIYLFYRVVGVEVREAYTGINATNSTFRSLEGGQYNI